MVKREPTIMNVKEIRERLGLTQSELAKILGLSSQVRIAEYENGTRNPSTAIKIILLLLDKKIISLQQLQKILSTL